MGRLGPLTSQALGRSPYDDVVEGSGEPDPHEPERTYDEKGRILNPETKRIIKSVIRAHNEVMLVIGVAEPENSNGDSPEIVMAKEHQAYESETGRTLLSIGRCLNIFGIWGVHGVRQRIMLYKPYSHVEFSQLLSFERQRHSFSTMLLAGVPSFLVMQGIHWCRFSVDSVAKRPWLRAGLTWCQFNFHLFVTLQRLGLISSSRWFPDIKFFIPFSSTSPISAPPPLETLSPAAIGGWLTQVAVNVAPYAAFYLCGRLWNAVHINIWPHIHKRLPQPSRNAHYTFRTLERQAAAAANPEERWQTVPESPTLGAADREIRHVRNPDQDLPTLQALEGQSTAVEPGIPFGAIRRQSTFSSRGGDQDYGTDEEDAEMINPTLISFDVDTSESTEQPAGVWSAELRPSFGVDGRSSVREEPIYMVNALTSLPSVLAADFLTNFFCYMLCAPSDGMAIRAVARAFACRRRLPTTNMYELSMTDAFSWRGVGNILGLEIIRLLISGDVWALTTILSQWLHVTEEEWKEIHNEEQEDRVARETAARETIAQETVVDAVTVTAAAES